MGYDRAVISTDVGVLSAPKFYLHLHPQQSASLAQVVAEAVGDLERAKWLIEFGAVYVDQRRRTETMMVVSPRDLIRIHTKPKRYPVDRTALLERVVHETDDFLVVNKPSGLPMHPTLDNLYENLISAFGRPLHITHRLDVPTSGLVVVAKTKEYQSLFNRLVAARAIKKTYQALTSRPLPLGAHHHWMRKSVKAPKELHAAVPSEEAAQAFENCDLIVTQCEAKPPFFKSTIELITGRTHQIRAQFSFLGAALLGDEMYGGLPYGRFGLHASGLSFTCPKTSRSFDFRLEIE